MRWRANFGLPLVLLLGAVLAIVPGEWPPWARMWALAGAVYVGCKWLSWSAAAADRGTVGRRIGYWVAWPGMDAAAFLTRTAEPPRATETAGATLRLAAGGALIWGLVPVVPAEAWYLRGWVGMIGIVLLLHFGLFALASCGWRAAGICAKPLMDRPLAARRLGEFWARRWNTAFHDLTHQFVMRPWSSRIGQVRARWLGFVASGLVHDLVISVPAGAGYGGPTAYFALQSLGISFERSSRGRRWLARANWRGHAFTLGAAAAPAVLLFHPPFVERVVVPFLVAIGAAR